MILIPVSVSERVIDLAVEIQQIPAPTFAEQERAAFVASRMEAEGLWDVRIDEIGNVYARLAGQNKKPPLVLTAHLDTVFPVETDLSVRRGEEKVHGPAIGDNSLGVAGLFGLVWALKALTDEEGLPGLPGEVWLVANVAEEGLGDLKGMRSVVERFADRPLAYIVLEGMALGQIYHRGLGVRRYRVTAQGPGGHSWVDFGRPSAVHELARLVSQLSTINLPVRPRTTMNVGTFQGGISINTIAPVAKLELDLRSEKAQALQNLAAQVEAIVAAASQENMKITAEVIGERPIGEIRVSHPLVKLAQRCVKEQGLEPYLGIGSTDANIPLSLGLPAITIGLTRGDGAHTDREFIHTAPLRKGLAQLVSLVQRAFVEL